MSQWSSSVMVDEDVLGVVLLICCCLIFLVFELLCVYFFFFFQAEDGIRDGTVTGVQTCALPISERAGARGRSAPSSPWSGGGDSHGPSGRLSGMTSPSSVSQSSPQWHQR